MMARKLDGNRLPPLSVVYKYENVESDEDVDEELERLEKANITERGRGGGKFNLLSNAKEWRCGAERGPFQ